MTVFPHVKLNLGLRVLRRRSDGFHELETLFFPWHGFSDELSIEPAGEFSISIWGPSYTGWPVEEDLTARAWRLLNADFGIGPVRISLCKRSPVGAGLGGGSADAAAALCAMNDIFFLGLPPQTLARYAARLGSDCAFFVYDTPMLASGRGELLEPFPLDLSGYDIEVALPEGVSVSTREAYAGLDLTAAPPAGELRKVLSMPVESWRGHLLNDFEPSVFAAHPQIAALKEKMYSKGAVYAAMSGSGSAVFGIFAR